MRLKIEYYGNIREQVKQSIEEYTTKSKTINALLQEIQQLHSLKLPTSVSSFGENFQPFIVAINANLIQPAQFMMPDLFKDGDTVALMPPFAGG